MTKQCGCCKIIYDISKFRFVPKKGIYTTYCTACINLKNRESSQRIRDYKKRLKVKKYGFCEVCGERMELNTHNKKFCSRKCFYKQHKDRIYIRRLFYAKRVTKGKNSYKRYTQKEKSLILFYKEEGLTIYRLAKMLGRSIEGIEKKRMELKREYNAKFLRSSNVEYVSSLVME